MAKKVKTPEEVQVALEKKVAKRTLFFSTFRTALAYFLAIALTFAIVTIAFAPKGGTAVAESTTKVEDKDAFEGQEGLSEGATYVDENGETQTALTTADAVKLLNDATAAAANAGYDWERACYYTKPLQVDGKDTLNKAIGMVDSNASVDSVVGGFLDITGEGNTLNAKKAKGSSAAPDGMKDKFLLKGTSLTEADVKQFIQSQDDPTIYMFQLNACANPQKDGGNALNHVTNDFITQSEVDAGIKEALGGAGNLIALQSTDVSFTEITIVAKIVDGKLESLQINYLMTVTSLKLKALVANVEGSGEGKVEETYKNFAY